MANKQSQFNNEKERLEKLFLNRRRRKDEPEPGDGELNVNHAKYTVEKEVSGAYLMKRVLMICFYILYFLWPIALAFMFRAYYLIFAIALELILFRIVYFQTWGFVSKEYAVVVTENDFIAAIIMGNAKVKKLAMTKVSTATAICPCEDKYLKHFGANQIKNSIDITGNKSSNDRYFIIYKNEAGEDCVVFFEAAQKLLKALKHYNSSATVVSQTSK